jgi:NAD+ kinase
MRIAVHGRLRYVRDMDRVIRMLERVEGAFTAVSLSHELAMALDRKGKLGSRNVLLADGSDIASVDMLVSIGGDGTILESARMVGASGVPVLGINNGRLGFLSSTPQEELDVAIEQLQRGNFTVEQRSLLEMNCENNPFGDKRFALNELTVHKSNRTSMIVIHAYLDDVFLNTYWADGLIVSTPTGSTGYSLSAGGPIVSPAVSSIVISPIAPHNLNVRPLVLPDSYKVSLEVEGRASDHLVSLDSVSYQLKQGMRLDVQRADFTVGLVRFNDTDYFQTLRNKLMWGIDSRN